MYGTSEHIPENLEKCKRGIKSLKLDKYDDKLKLYTWRIEARCSKQYDLIFCDESCPEFRRIEVNEK